MNQIERIKIKLRLAKCTDLFLEVFGADSHKYKVGKPLSLSELTEFEKNYNIQLPESYRLFLTEVGNGGNNYPKSVRGNSASGPNFGIYKLGSFLMGAVVNTKYGILEKEAIINSRLTEFEWNKMVEKAVKKEHDNSNEFNNSIANLYSGILTIGYCGGSEYQAIVLNGKEKGRVLFIYDEIECCPYFAKEVNFLDWYENWLDRIISGEEIMSNDYLGELQKEESTISDFISQLDDNYWQFKKLGYLRYFPTLSKRSIKLLWKKYNSTTELDQKICLLNFLTKFDYYTAKNEISAYHKAYPIPFLRNLHLYAREKTYEWKEVINRIKTDNSSNSDVLAYIEFISNHDIKTSANNA